MQQDNTIHSKDETFLYGFDKDTGEVFYEELINEPRDSGASKQIDWFQMKNFARRMPGKSYDLLEHIVTKELDGLGNLNKPLREICSDRGVDYDRIKKDFKKFRIDYRMYPVFVKRPYKHR